MSAATIIPLRFRLWILLLLLGATGTAGALDSPTHRVKAAIRDVIAVLGEEGLSREERWQQVGQVINRSFDFQAMSQSVLATNWRKASPAEQQRFIEFFSQYLEDTYRAKIEGYEDQEIRYLSERITGDRATVDTVIVAGGKEIPVSYRLRVSDERWLAYDVVIEGVSLVNNYRNTFSAIVRTEGMDGLLNDLQGRIAKHRAQQREPDDSSPGPGAESGY